MDEDVELTERPTMRSDRKSRANACFIGQSDQIGDAANAQLGHHSSAVHFHGFLDGPEARGDLLIKAACNDVFEHFAFSLRESCKALAD